MEKSRIKINKKIVEKTKVVEVNGDIIVPDIKPDIINIINTNGNAYIYKQDISAGRIRVDGNIDTYIVYLSDNGETRSIQTTLTFAESIEDAKIQEESFIKSRVKIQAIDTKVLNERKISTKISLKIEIECYSIEEIEFLNNIDELENVEKQKSILNINSMIGRNSVKATIREDIGIEEADSISEILKTNIEIKNIENKISYNKVLAKADANIKIIYQNEEGKIFVKDSIIPIMSFIDLENITENNICFSEYNIRNMLFKINNTSSKSISCQVEFEVVCEAFESREIEIIQDLYGIKQEIDFSKKEVEVLLSNEEKDVSAHILENIVIEDINNILHVECMPDVVSLKGAGDTKSCECELKMEVYYEADNKAGLNVKNVNLPFVIKLDNNSENIALNVNKSSFNINNENVECDIEICAKQKQGRVKSISILDNIEKKELTQNNDYKMSIYFVKAGDTLWNIAKKFKVCMTDIIKTNNLENPDKLKIGERLYIVR